MNKLEYFCFVSMQVSPLTKYTHSLDDIYQGITLIHQLHQDLALTFRAWIVVKILAQSSSWKITFSTRLQLIIFHWLSQRKWIILFYRSYYKNVSWYINTRVYVNISKQIFSRQDGLIREFRQKVKHDIRKSSIEQLASSYLVKQLRTLVRCLLSLHPAYKIAIIGKLNLKSTTIEYSLLIGAHFIGTVLVLH